MPRFENYIKGDLAESIISRLFRTLGFQVKYNGIEAAHPELLYLKDTKKIRSDLIRKKSQQPDLIIFKEADENFTDGFFREVEIKYREKSEISSRGLKEYPDDTHFIFVDKKNFWSMNYEQLIEVQAGNQKTLKFSSLTLLENDSIFCFTKEQTQIIDMYKNYAALISRISLKELSSEKAIPP